MADGVQKNAETLNPMALCTNPKALHLSGPNHRDVKPPHAPEWALRSECGGVRVGDGPSVFAPRGGGDQVARHLRVLKESSPPIWHRTHCGELPESAGSGAHHAPRPPFGKCPPGEFAGAMPQLMVIANFPPHYVSRCCVCAAPYSSWAVISVAAPGLCSSRAQGSGFGVQGSGFRGHGLGFGVLWQCRF
jgi:hypothetical protein